MKIEFLVLVTNDDSFCNSKKAFVDFLKVDSLISITGQKLTYKKTPKSRPLITVKFKVETDDIPSNKERYFLIALENTNDELVEEFAEVGNKIKQISKRINPESTVVNILWDDIGRHYAHKAYPLINDVENVMRKLISKFMLINVGMDWSKETIHPDLAKKIEKFEEEDAHLNDLYKLDFINLSEVLFQKKRDITLDELDRVLLKTKFDDSDRAKILKYIPKSNWEKYFSSLLDENSQGLEKKWELLYKLRNKVAHNRFLTREDFEKIKGLTSQVKGILSIAMNKLGEIDLDEEDREQIIHFYQSESPRAIGFLAENAVAEYFMRNGAEVVQPRSRFATDFIVVTPQGNTAIEVKSFSHKALINSLRLRIARAVMHVKKCISINNIDKGEVIVVVHGIIDEMMTPRLLERLESVRSSLNSNIAIKIGFINESGSYEPLDI
ncbi:HEPN domain-containing protein [Photobacterium sp. 1_MG-2023]|uniref:HEPN domain-containing protein n=1 Tax=Photobacterium sp. 1_MG-2023 TaxID=3062646 RepID=UPI0026E2FE0B|nr:HEPN domain-containing protein [Photobacterium sp. 1_MG-2023]MDO6708948.1 HEPN domain-containing protein [Photobacterium sp. 1_MG-2023]